MLELPSETEVSDFAGIKLWIAPPATNHITFNRNDLPTRQDMEYLGWKETSIGCAAERDVNVRGGLVARRMQYSLKHIGATTINKSQGATLPYGIVVEISKEYSPWESGQIVVSLSRSETSDYTIIVGEKDYAINKMWELLIVGNQWTRYTKHILDIVTVDRRDNEQDDENCYFNHPEVYHFWRIDATIPLDNTGFVYCLVSVPNPQKIYIGTTKNLSQRLQQHNNGTGAEESHDPRDLPWGVGGYICGLSHMNRIERMSLEQSWKVMVQDMKNRGNNESYAWIMSGERVVDIYNRGSDDDAKHICFVCHVTAGE